MVDYEEKCSSLLLKKSQVEAMHQLLSHQEDKADRLVNIFIDYQEKNRQEGHPAANLFEELEQLI